MSFQSSGLTAVNGAVAIPTGGTAATPGIGAVCVNVTGTFVATLVFEATTDGGTSWFAVSAWPVASPGIVSGVPVQSVTGAGQWVIPVQGFNQIRVRCSAFTSGTANVAIESSASGFLCTSVGGTGVQNVQSGLADTIEASSNASGPTAGTTVATITLTAAGVWEISYATGLLSGSPVAADGGNMVLKQNTTALLAKLPVPAAIGYQPGPAPLRVTAAANDTITIAAIGNATAAVIYAATLIAKRVA